MSNTSNTTDQAEAVCGICLEPFSETVQAVRTIPCNHTSHCKSCIFTWLTQANMTCPLDRREITNVLLASTGEELPHPKLPIPLAVSEQRRDLQQALGMPVDLARRHDDLVAQSISLNQVWHVCWWSLEAENFPEARDYMHAYFHTLGDFEHDQERLIEDVVAGLGADAGQEVLTDIRTSWSRAVPPILRGNRAADAAIGRIYKYWLIGTVADGEEVLVDGMMSAIIFETFMSKWDSMRGRGNEQE